MDSWKAESETEWEYHYQNLKADQGLGFESESWYSDSDN